MKSFVRAALFAGLACAGLGCEEAAKEPAWVSEDILAATPAAIAAPAPEPAAERQRVFTLPDMVINECTTIDASGKLVGKKCPTGCLAFGPYASAPAGADLRMSFDVESKSTMIVGSDIISGGNAYFHAALEEQSMRPREKRHMSYRIHFFQPAERIEARFWIRTDEPASFEVSNFYVQVL